MCELPDGTGVGFRSASRMGGPAIDLFSASGPNFKVHIE
jgi:hypothetical protein